MKRLLSSLLLAGLFSSCQSADPRFGDFEICDDTIDNNSNGFTDCADDECRTTDPVCAPPEQCEDNIDNDFNGDTDCRDEACAGAAPCLCFGTAVIFPDQLPITFEGDTAEGVEAVNVFGCQTGDALESFFNLSFLDVSRVNVKIESLDGIQMVLQTTDDCQEDSGFSVSCSQSGVFNNFDVSTGPTLFFVGAREAGLTGRFRITFSEPL